MLESQPFLFRPGASTRTCRRPRARGCGALLSCNVPIKYTTSVVSRVVLCRVSSGLVSHTGDPLVTKISAVRYALPRISGDYTTGHRLHSSQHSSGRLACTGWLCSFVHVTLATYRAARRVNGTKAENHVVCLPPSRLNNCLADIQEFVVPAMVFQTPIFLSRALDACPLPSHSSYFGKSPLLATT